MATSSGWRIVTAAADAIVALGLGSNVGDRFANIACALVMLHNRIGTLTALSRVYITEPVGFRDQPDFWNCAALLRTRLEPLPLFREVKAIERELGRDTPFAGGPRNIDIDVLLYDDVVLMTNELEIPHPRLHERAFVLRPLAEIAPQWVHPRLDATIAALLPAVHAQHASPLETETELLRAHIGMNTEQPS